MRKLKKGLSSLLAAVMLLSVLPVSALAEEAGDLSAPDEVIYNLGTMEVTVGTDEEKLETAEVPYDLFDEDGNYTMDLGPDAFFPYEVQFTCNGDTWTEWFMDADDTVEVGGRTFSVSTYVSDPAALTGLSFEIAGRTVTAYPEEKEFTNEGPSMALMSLMPIKEYRGLQLDMTGYLPDELKAVEVSYILSGMAAASQNVDTDDLVVWSKGYNSDDYTIAGQSGTIDLSPEYKSSSSVRLELVVGTDDQLDMSNIRYILSVYITPSDDLLTATVRTADRQSAIDVYDTHLWERSQKQTILEIGVEPANWTSGEEAYLSLGLSDDFSDIGLTTAVYEGLYDSEEAALTANAQTIDDIWEQGDMASQGGHLADYSYKWSYQGMPEVTVVLKRGDTVALVCPLILYMYEDEMGLSFDGIYAESNGSYTYISNGGSSRWDNMLDMEVRTVKLQSGYPANGTYYVQMYLHNPAVDHVTDNGVAYVERAVVGDFDTAAAIRGQSDIKDQLFGDGYPADYSRGVIFSVLDVKGGVHQMKLSTAASSELPAAPRPDSQDTYFRMESAKAVTDTGTKYVNYYVMPYEHDGYYYNGYQTVFLLNSDGTPVDAQELVPTFYTGDQVTMYAGLDHTSGTEQKSGETAIAFRDGEPIQYSAAAESKGHLKNYWVTFVTQQAGGPSLFVNATNDPDRVDEKTDLPVREVFLTEEYDYHHDVFFANMGDAEMTGIYVKLENAENVALDDYWTVREDAPAENRVLGTFDSTSDKAPDGSYVSYGELANVAKVRLVPTEDSVGVISGTLVIGYKNEVDEGEEVRIKLTGTSGTPKITTETIVDGVKYVPYNSVIQTNSMGASDAVSFSVTSGSLPTGVALYPNGKLYGMPTKAGSYTFTVTAAYNGDASLSDSKTFTITIKENTNANVDAATDMGYTVLDRVPGTMTEYTDQVFRSEGTYSYFYKFYLDGQELTEGTDFVSEEGSTKITVRAQTFKDAGSGTHTIAAEFRTDKSDTNTVKCAAQNYTVPKNSSSGSSGGASKPSIQKPTTPPPKTTADIFRDITAQDWYYADVDWGYQNKLMIGVASDLYAPYGLISPATVVTVLARMDKVDLSQYDGVSYPEIAGGQWYTNAAVWAKETGLLSEGEFSAVPPIARAKFAVMLVKYLESKEIDCTLPEGPVTFADADLMTQEENDAFQVLYQFGIFKGIGGYAMAPQGSTTRAQLAVLLHRLSVFVEQSR